VLCLISRRMFAQEIRVNWAFQREKLEETGAHHQIFVGDLGAEVNDKVLLEAFSQHCVGCIDARVMWDQVTGRSKSYGFVSFR
jgi:nucleolysin TIA-1/TIAR